MQVKNGTRWPIYRLALPEMEKEPWDIVML